MLLVLSQYVNSDICTNRNERTVIFESSQLTRKREALGGQMAVRIAFIGDSITLGTGDQRIFGLDRAGLCCGA
jgi:hypothetical protein